MQTFVPASQAWDATPTNASRYAITLAELDAANDEGRAICLRKVLDLVIAAKSYLEVGAGALAAGALEPSRFPGA